MHRNRNGECEAFQLKIRFMALMQNSPTMANKISTEFLDREKKINMNPILLHISRRFSFSANMAVNEKNQSKTTIHALIPP